MNVVQGYLISLFLLFCTVGATDQLLRGRDGAADDFPRHLAGHSRLLNLRINQRWKNRFEDVVQIPYVIDPEFFDKEQTKLIEDSIRVLEEGSNVIKFVPRRSQKAYIRVKNESGGCGSSVGKSADGKVQDINLASRCLKAGTIQHEFLHALGFHHEHNRPDRDSFVFVFWDNIIEKNKAKFEKEDSTLAPVLGTAYDINSLMHYDRFAFAKNHSEELGYTLWPRGHIENPDDVVIGQRDGPSEQDLIKLRLMYQCWSGPRTLAEYERDRCTPDCKCWKGAIGCSGNDAACQGTLTCEENQCVISVGGGTSDGRGCTDHRDFEDSEGNGCDWYEDQENPLEACSRPEAISTLGWSANNACCVCGGGSLGGVSYWKLAGNNYLYSLLVYYLELALGGTPEELEFECLYLNEASTKNGNSIILSPCTDSKAQEWWIDNNGYIRSALDETKCIVPSRGETAEGTNLIINDCIPNDARFAFKFNVSGQDILSDDRISLNLALAEIHPMNDDDICLSTSSTFEGHVTPDKAKLDTCDPLTQLLTGLFNQVWMMISAYEPLNSPQEEIQATLKNSKDCKDAPFGWYDAYNFNCEWYSKGTNCDDYGSTSRSFGRTANQACCACGGGTTLNIRDSEVEEDPIAIECWNTPFNWVDSVGDGCTWYEQGENCAFYGDQFGSEFGTANQACCACGGGSKVPSPESDISEIPGCSDSPAVWIDSENDGCVWYSKGNNCEQYGHEYIGVDGKTARDACCVCGGGNNPTTSCIDSPVGWKDSEGDGCEAYSQDGKVDPCTVANDFPNEEGVTANDACCACGGGTTPIAQDEIEVVKASTASKVWLPAGLQEGP